MCASHVLQDDDRPKAGDRAHSVALYQEPKEFGGCFEKILETSGHISLDMRLCELFSKRFGYIQGSLHVYKSTASLSHLRTMLPESSSCPQPALRPIHAT